MKKTTLQDISEYTGLSISTVSRILRGESGSNTQNVEKTIDAALRLKYPLNVGFLKNKYKFKSQIRIALLTTLFPSEFYSALLAGINNAAESTNFDITIHHLDLNRVNIINYTKELITQDFQGAILFLPLLDEEVYEQLVNEIPSSFAFISVLPIQNPTIDTITFDSYGGGYLIAQHFHKKGYLDVGIVNGPFDRQESLLRRNGFQDYISKHPEMNLMWSYDGDFEYMDGFSAFAKYLNSSNKPRAVFCANDVMCLSFLSKATEYGIQIPNELALAGFDDLPLCKYVHPAITSISTDYMLLGRKALGVLSSKLNGDERQTGIQSLIPVSISKREST
jgi:DNA-binding LacI/PurR family transcriptional regulator